MIINGPDTCTFAHTMDEQLPEMITVEVGSLQEQIAFMGKMSSMQRTHNMLAKDIETLLALTNEQFTNPDRMQPLIRACLKELFSLVEADLYLINQFIPYPDFKERDDLGQKFKKTFRHHARTFKKEDIVKAFQERFYANFYKLKLKRDDIVHPKGLHSIEVKSDDLTLISEVYKIYRNFVIQLMTNVGVSTKIPWKDFLSGNINI